MASAIGKSDSVRFDQPQDWIKWSREFRIKTKSLNLWTYIDPDNRIPWPVELVAPVISNYPKRVVRIETRISSSRTIETNLSPAQEEPDTHNAPRTTSEMTTEGRASYQLDMNNYMFLKNEFKDYRTSLDKLTDWITSTTGSSIRQSCCNECWQVPNLNTLTELLSVVWTDLHAKYSSPTSLSCHVHQHMTHSSHDSIHTFVLASRLQQGVDTY
jgi:hypothetical protein